MTQLGKPAEADTAGVTQRQVPLVVVPLMAATAPEAFLGMAQSSAAVPAARAELGAPSSLKSSLAAINCKPLLNQRSV
jgi:hypothetical protein